VGVVVVPYLNAIGLLDAPLLAAITAYTASAWPHFVNLDVAPNEAGFRPALLRHVRLFYVQKMM
jgi:hypothetical protein